MKIKDIIKEDSEFSPGIQNTLEQMGYEFLGQGIDQMAFLEPKTGQVLKIFGAGNGHDMAVYWINYCQKNGKNPFLPKFSGWTKFEFEGEEYMQIRMERLGPFPNGWGQALARIANNAEDDALYHDNKRNRAAHDSKLGDTNIYNRYDSNPEARNELAIILGDNYDLFWETISDLAKIGDSKGWMLDLHSGNFLSRNDGTPVIVDPWAE